MGWGNAYSGQSVGSQPQVKSTVFNQQLLETEDAKYMESHIFMEKYQYVKWTAQFKPTLFKGQLYYLCSWACRL